MNAYTFNIRREDRFGFARSLLQNKVVSGALLLFAALQLLAVYAPFMNRIFQTVPLVGIEWLLITTGAAVSALAVHLVKKLIH